MHRKLKSRGITHWVTIKEAKCILFKATVVGSVSNVVFATLLLHYGMLQSIGFPIDLASKAIQIYMYIYVYIRVCKYSSDAFSCQKYMHSN